MAAACPPPFSLVDMEERNVVTQPDQESEARLNAILEAQGEDVALGNGSVRVGWLRAGTIRKFTDIMNDKKHDASKVNAKAVACIVLNGYWKIRLFWWLVWRWYYYVRQYHEAELTPVIEAGKKKVPVEAYLVNTISLTGMRDTMMQMTKEEVERIQAAHLGAR